MGIFASFFDAFFAREDPTGAVLGYVIDMPVIALRQVPSYRGDVVDTTVVAQMQIPMVRFS